MTCRKSIFVHAFDRALTRVSFSRLQWFPVGVHIPRFYILRVPGRKCLRRCEFPLHTRRREATKMHLCQRSMPIWKSNWRFARTTRVHTFAYMLCHWWIDGCMHNWCVYVVSARARVCVHMRVYASVTLHARLLESRTCSDFHWPFKKILREWSY